MLIANLISNVVDVRNVMGNHLVLCALSKGIVVISTISPAEFGPVLTQLSNQSHVVHSPGAVPSFDSFKQATGFSSLERS